MLLPCTQHHLTQPVSYPRITLQAGELSECTPPASQPNACLANNVACRPGRILHHNHTGEGTYTTCIPEGGPTPGIDDKSSGGGVWTGFDVALLDQLVRTRLRV